MKKLLDVLDIVVFAVVVAACAWVAASGMGTGRDHLEAALGRVGDAETRLKAALEEDRYEGTEGARTLDLLLTLPDVVKQRWYPPEPHGGPLSSGIFYHEGSLEDLREGRDLELRFLPPEGLTAVPDIGVVALIWRENDRNTVHVTGYRVYRTGPDGREVLTAPVDADTLRYEDRSVRAGELYSYRVSAVTDEEILVRRGRAESPKSSAVTVRGKKDYELVPVAWDAGTRRLRVRVRKSSGGVWHEKEFDVIEGEGVGAADPGSGVDYATGCTAVRIEAAEEEVTETRREVVFDPSGRVVAENGEPLTREATYTRKRPVVTLTFKNEVGAVERLVWRP